PLLDLPSRNYYRNRVEEIASAYNISGIHVAREAIGLAKSYYINRNNSEPDNNNQDNDMRYGHVGYYLVGKGIKDLTERLSSSSGKAGKISDIAGKHHLIIYLGPIILLTLLLSLIAVYYSALNTASYGVILSLVTLIAVFVPASDIAVNIVNRVVCNMKKPTVFPRLELKEGIPENLSTIVIVPALLPDEKRVWELLENLEMHYLANKEKNLFFSLLGDFKDSPESSMDNDEKIINAAMEGIKRLNEKYAKDGQDIFYFFHRKRIYNKSQNKWMGWERKRGAIIEFNDLLLGSKETSFSYFSNENFPSGKIKYVITLDADTILPMGAAKKMIGTMAHPLNKPVIDEGRGIVVEGYGLVQPRILFDIESSNKSLFSRIFTGQEGIDPYASAISDVYQDLFGEGIFTGKGIYDLKVFQTLLKDAIPENSVLSHDLLEGSYVRTGLVTDLELVDSYPTKYNSYASRLHRWVRGDWQLLPWIFCKVCDRQGRRVKNPLNALSKWKIVDNMRRSLVMPFLMLIVVLGFSILPGSAFFWLGVSLLTIAFPLIVSGIDYVVKGSFLVAKIKHHIPVISGVKATFLQIVLMFLFLPYQAYLMADAIIVTLIRVLFTRKGMLEWVTAADVEKGAKNTLESYYRKMKGSIFLAVIVVILALTFKPAEAGLSLLLLGIWSLSPFVAYHISKASEEAVVPLPSEDIRELRRIARKTWRYFEEFINFKNHFLVPDNYQEDPSRGIAYRTSPTNIGLGMLSVLTARDFGYIGTLEMVDTISNIVSTVEKMEKWNGHLFNWYDTRTLRPLKPRYVSTVDSGNYVGYLITLVHGLNDYLESPFVDAKLVNGIEDTLSLANLENLDINEELGLLHKAVNTQNADLCLWSDALNRFCDKLKAFAVKRSVWKAKVEKMARTLKRELDEFMSWLDVFKESPDMSGISSTNGDIFQIVENVIKSLNVCVPLKDMPVVYKNAINSIEEAISLMKSGTYDYGAVQSWLASLKEEVEKSLLHTEHFIEKINKLIERIKQLSDATEFLPLYSKKKQLFSIGYNVEENRLTNSYYDLLASEARQTSYIAIARGEVPPKHWFKLGRSLTTIDRYKGLVSWSGTMFEYLMPCLIMKNYKNTLLDETYSFVIRSQKKYGRQRRIPWGASESGFYSLDINLDYQYKAIGVPWLGLKRGLIEDAVVAPYATFLALPFDPESAMSNIRELKAEGAEGPYGFYEAVDYTPERLTFGEKRAVVRSFMAHHQGMCLLSLNNYLNDNIMQKRFHSDPVVRTAQLLLQEKVPSNIIFTKDTKEKVAPFKGVVYKEKVSMRRFKKPGFRLPRVHILSNGNYSVLITDRGTGYSKIKTAMITRWREDSVLDNYGMFFYLRNIEKDYVWSATYAPFNIIPDRYEVVFTSDKAKFKRVDGDIETLTEIVVASGDNVEIRRILLKNNGDTPYTIEVTSYFEVVLASQSADIAHPAFSNLFVRTEFIAENKCIIANRRPRSENDKKLWAANTAVVEGDLIGDVQYETDRMQFIGRGRNVTSPVAIKRNKPLSNSSGPVLDPIMSLRLRVKIEPGKTARISFITAVSESIEILQELIEKYSVPESIGSAFRLALTRSQVEARYLNMKNTEIELYQDMISHIIYNSPLRNSIKDYIALNKKGQSSLWPYGISGDLPIVLVVLKKADEADIVYEILKAHEYWKTKDLRVDLVIINDEEASYDNPLRSLLYDILSSSHAHDMINRPGGVYILNRENLAQEDISLLYAVSRLVLRGDGGTLSEQIKLPSSVQTVESRQNKGIVREYEQPVLEKAELVYFNELGGFSRDGREYVIILEKDQNTPLPWINVISNPGFGFLVSESGSGYTWCENSRENKLTPWSNDPVSDSPGEIIYIRDNDTDELWSPTPLPLREAEPYIIRHGFGYTIFEHTSHGIKQELLQFVPVDDPVKISMLKLKNISRYERDLTLTYYIRPVLGVSDQFTSMHINTRMDESGILLIENPYNEEFSGRIAFVSSSGSEISVTGDRREFFGSGGIRCPDALKNQKLSGNVGAGYDPCAVLQVNVKLSPGQAEEVIFLLGQSTRIEKVREIAGKYTDIAAAEQSLESVRKFWEDKLGSIRVKTPDLSMDILLNGWLLYQVISCRMWARTAFYQSGGAFGFRDQLQDSLSVMQIWPEIARKQILLHASHQFIEGDVQHWWHEPEGKGVRTRFSDDRLWLPYTVSEYIRITGDWEILREQVPFIEDEPLKEFEDERYSKPKISETKASIYEHCLRAIERSLNFGEHGIPLIGSGDWNDGMSTVGNRGRGESVWLGWFLYSILTRFASICSKNGDEERADRYAETAAKIADSIERNAWDGSWYRRAYFDNGIPLGSAQNSECKIDSIAQTWAVISGAGERQRVIEAMNSVEQYLVQRDDGLIKLLTPPFDEGELEPGYIKGYAPGVRENGGQYTHAAAWVIIAFAKLGDGDKAWELFELINPINHTRTHIEYARYKAEPYVMAADVYAVNPHVGRGGWTWYTGSASWMYRAGVEYILGLKKDGETLLIEPCIPKKWSEYSVKYRYFDTTYEITVINNEGVNTGVKRISVDGQVSAGNAVCLVNDGNVHMVEVYMGR
ncbi:MAG TPA: glycosyl transferase, partial [Clostridiaceae bacterium]|nr:glycosyl transferase [Clostridiaceae bacterium]